MAVGIIGAFNELPHATRLAEPPEAALRLQRLPPSSFPLGQAGSPEAMDSSLYAQASLARFTSSASAVTESRSSLAHQAGRVAVLVDRTPARVLWSSEGLQIQIADELKVSEVIFMQASPEAIEPEHFEVFAIPGLSMIFLQEPANVQRPQAACRFEGQPSTRRTPYVSLIRSLIENDQISRARSMLNALPEEVMIQSQVRALSRVLAVPKVSTTEIKDIDRGREYQWLEEHEYQYRGQWVAVDGDKLVLSAGSLKELLDGLKRLNLRMRPLIHRFG